ncbi:Response regulator receiver domain protein (CheY) [alpha proteobacterium BAL199]|jgi:two-component system, chemotaxis family, chemotaxis protein CheY|nr:Response regulator receiver domain protein (CheY) [alpha proteobacterium BAL199]
MTIDPDRPLSPKPLPTYAGLRVLLAEDEPMATKLAQGALKVMGITDIVAVRDGEQALAVLEHEQGRFQLIVSDWNMPRMSGLEFLKAVRRRFPHMKFVMLTGKATSDFVVAAREHGVDAYVVKPFSPNQLRRKIESLFTF